MSAVNDEPVMPGPRTSRSDRAAAPVLAAAPADAAPEPAPDPRVAAVLEVLAGTDVVAVAARWNVEAPLLRRWVSAFVDAGTAQVTNRPDPDAAHRRDRFLTAFAHELRTPLTVAQGWVELLVGGDIPAAAAQRTIGRLDDALHRLAERVLDVQLLGESSLGLVRLAPTSVTVGELVEGLGIDVADDAAGVRLCVDVALFRRVLRDLWEAASGAPAPRSLHLTVRRPTPWVELRIVRDADPIEPRVLQALFEPFDVNDDATGVTMGLYLARALTVAHGGTLGIEQDDDGAALWVRVPATRHDLTTTTHHTIEETP